MNTLYSQTASPLLVSESIRVALAKRLKGVETSATGQVFTPSPVADFMASLCTDANGGSVRLLDPGAGLGTLTAAFVDATLRLPRLPQAIHADLYEIDGSLREFREETLDACRRACIATGVNFTYVVHETDFIRETVELISFSTDLFGVSFEPYTHCIMNPPYKKIHSSSNHRKMLRSIGIETSNLYSAFFALAVRLMANKGKITAIVPRSFCNGPYFLPFRRFLLAETAIKHLHVFGKRNETFKDADVLQENIILAVEKGGANSEVKITSSDGPSFDTLTERTVPYPNVVNPNDSDCFIHLATSAFDQSVVQRMSSFTTSLDDLGIDVCTGPVVDFRLREDIHYEPEHDSSPLVYAAHCREGFVQWPNHKGRKPNGIRVSERSSKWLMPTGWYTITRRFSAKEEKKRIVATLFDPARVAGQLVGFENHLNVFHHKKGGLEPSIAKGLAVYLNSTLLDLYFRQFSGHTQVNATDLRSLRYPSKETLRRFGASFRTRFPKQTKIDALVEGEIADMANRDHNLNPLTAQRRIDESLRILGELGLPRAQQNERSALTLLALLGLTPDMSWLEASAPLMGITPIMTFCEQNYGKNYAPNTRETFRRQTMHQFVDAGIVVPNPDAPNRPINSPHWVYQIESQALQLLRTFGTEKWHYAKASYLGEKVTLAARYARERKMKLLPVKIAEGKEIRLSAGLHSNLIKDIIESFAPRYASGSRVLYVGDTGSKLAYFDEDAFADLQLELDAHGKFPDVVLYCPGRNWLFLIESVTSHGPVNPKRREELQQLFTAGSAGLVYVTAFPDRATMAKYLPEVSWETEVWVADSPSHLIHFNGERFLGPYED